MMQFDLPRELSSIIKVIGVGGGGSNAVNYMFRQGIKGVDFIVCNTDKQALDISPVPVKIQLGQTLTEGLGAGMLPEVGKNAAIESIDTIKTLLSNNTKMVFITAGMGKGTGTGAAPVIARAARELGILTVGIVTIPFQFEGAKKKIQAEAGIEELKKNVDTLLVICNERLREIHGNLTMVTAFSHADNVLCNAARSIAEIISNTLHVNVDFNDIQTVMKDSGVAVMGTASASGDGRAINAVEMALNSPLLNDNDIFGARYVLLNVTSGTTEITMDEFGEITDYIQQAAGDSAEIVTGYGIDDTLGDRVSVTIIATGFKSKNSFEGNMLNRTDKKVHILSDVVVNKSVPDNFLPEITNETQEKLVNEEESLEPFLIVKPEQVTIEFETVPAKEEVVNESNAASTEKPIAIEPTFFNVNLNEPQLKKEQVVETKIELPVSDNVTNDEQIRKAQDRILRLKELSLKLKTPSGLSELEGEPAYKRRNIQLEQVPHSSESQVSRFTLSEGEDKKAEIKPNNSFLHDNVD